MVENQQKESKLSRRDAIKLATLGSLFTQINASASTVSQASKAKGRILIIGGGLAGISTAARLANSLENPDITIIEPNPNSVSYQAGNPFVATGLFDKSEIIYNTKDFIPNGVTLIKDKAIKFYPDKNEVLLASEQTINYDFLIIAAGLKLDFSKIKGLEEIGELYTLDNSPNINNILSNSGITTVYNTNAAEQTWHQMQKIISKAKENKKLKVIFTEPNTHIKCAGTPKKMLTLTHAKFKESKVRKNIDLSFYTSSKSMIEIKEYDDAIVKQFNSKDINWHYNHNLIEIDIKNKIAKFELTLGETSSVNSKFLNVEFDFINITPPMKAPDEIMKSKLGLEQSWFPINRETLQHPSYKNVFALGDIIDAPMGKTGGSIRKQYKVLVDNLISLMENKELISKYDGYTVYPIVTDIGKSILAEFNWTNKPSPSFPLEATQDRYIWWLAELYLIKPLTQYGMLYGKT